MATVTFTANLQRHVDCARQQVDAATLGAALVQSFERNPQVRGERLAMTSTSGNAWIGEHGGDDWPPLSSHLPPVAALAFGASAS